MNLAGPERNTEVQAWVQARTGAYSPQGSVSVMGFLGKDDQIVAGWMFERYTGPGGSVYTHWAGEGKRWLTRDVLSLVAIYVFGQLDADNVFGEVRKSDKAVRAIDEKLGFRKVAELTGYFPDDDLIVYRMQKNDCRWLPQDYKESPNG